MRRRRAALRLLLPLLLVLRCTYGHEQTGLFYDRPVVFPGEALLGATVLIALDSNLIAFDALERYDLHRSRVRILLDDDSADDAPVVLRSVFDLGFERSSALGDALGTRGWATLALVDLPTDADVDFGPSPAYPLFRELIVEVDGQPVPELRGLVKVLGPGGQPTVFDGIPLLAPIEDSLESQTLLRLRAVRGTPQSDGFDPAWPIAGIELTVRYEGACLAAPASPEPQLAPPRAYPSSEAAGAFAAFGPPLAAPSANPRGFLDPVEQRLLLVEPAGIALTQPWKASPTALGEGPFLDLAFDRTGDPACAEPLADYVELLDLVVYDRDGADLLNLAANGGGPDASRYFTTRAIDPDRPL